MDENFKPENEDERNFAETFDGLSSYMSEKVRSLPAEMRLPVLRDLWMSDMALMNLFLQAKKKEDYETCEVSKVLLMERGFEYIR